MSDLIHSFTEIGRKKRAIISFFKCSQELPPMFASHFKMLQYNSVRTIQYDGFRPMFQLPCWLVLGIFWFTVYNPYSL